MLDLEKQKPTFCVMPNIKEDITSPTSCENAILGYYASAATYCTYLLQYMIIKGQYHCALDTCCYL